MGGRTISHCESITKLGEGGTEAVYRARDAKLGGDLALSVLTNQLPRDPQRMGRFSRRAHVPAVLNRSSIASVHGLENQDGIHEPILELVIGSGTASRTSESNDESPFVRIEISSWPLPFREDAAADPRTGSHKSLQLTVSTLQVEGARARRPAL